MTGPPCRLALAIARRAGFTATPRRKASSLSHRRFMRAAPDSTTSRMRPPTSSIDGTSAFRTNGPDRAEAIATDVPVGDARDREQTVLRYDISTYRSADLRSDLQHRTRAQKVTRWPSPGAPYRHIWAPDSARTRPQRVPRLAHPFERAPGSSGSPKQMTVGLQPFLQPKWVAAVVTSRH
jgi:hypothetical protein